MSPEECAQIKRQLAETQAIARELQKRLMYEFTQILADLPNSNRHAAIRFRVTHWLDELSDAKAKGVLPALPPAESAVQPGTDTAAPQAQIPK